MDKEVYKVRLYDGRNDTSFTSRRMLLQIHHIDEDHANNDPLNLAVLCSADRDATQTRGGFGRTQAKHIEEMHDTIVPDAIKAQIEQRDAAKRLTLKKDYDGKDS